MKFGEKLSFLRKKQGMTQLELAEKLDVSRQAVSRWEQGTSEPSTGNLVTIGKLFDVSVDDLVNENIQLQAESTVQVAVAEEKATDEDKNRHSIAIIIGIVIFMMAVVIAVCIGLKKGQQESVPMEDLDKDITNTSEIVFLPID